MPNSTELSEAKRALLERYLRGDRQKPTPSSPRVIPRRASDGSVPLSFNQQQLWVIAQLIGDSPAYNECVTVHLPGKLNVYALEQSFNELIRRHEAWRTRFPVVDGQPVQQVQPELTFTLPVVDLRSLPRDSREAEALRRAKAEALPPFDLMHGPLLRATLMQLDDNNHRLFLTLHHIIFDGVTVYQVFLPELRALYEAFLTGQASPLPELPIQYADFAVWQRAQMQGEVLDKQLSYWKKQLADAPAVLELPADHPRPPAPSYRGAIRSLKLGKQLTGDLRAFCRREGCTLYVLLQAVFSTLLYRYTGQQDILIGTATSGRKHAEVQKLMGVFINMLAMRTNMAGNPTFRELLGRVRETTLEAQEHADVPFEYVVKELRPQREQGQNPFFQVLLMLEPAVASLPSAWTLTHMEINMDSSKFDLSLTFEDRPEGLIGWFMYSTDLFDASTIERLMGCWQTLLASIITDPTQSIDELPILTEAERQQILVEWNDTATDYPHDVCIHQLFDAQAESTPEAVAVVFNKEQITYRDLQHKSNQLASHLQSMGVGPEVLVGIFMERSLDMIVALLSILKAGGAYVPLDPTYPQERIAFMIQDSQVAVLLTQRRLVEKLPFIREQGKLRQQAKVFCLDTDWEVVAGTLSKNPPRAVTPRNLAYVIYTSGSTGTPKGVMIEHHSVVNLATALARTVYAQQRTPLRVGLNAPLAFDASVKQIVQLLFGHTLYILPDEARRDGTALLDYLDQHRLDVVDCTPVQLKLALSAGLAERSDLALSLVLVGGDVLDQTTWQALVASSKTRYYNVYGPTECTVDTTVCQMLPTVEASIIGHPLANVQTYILDKHRQAVPVGVPGELHIGGMGLARGYLNRLELTDERFIHHPFSQHPEARMYKTGDLVRYLPDGSIEFLGRTDHQVKIRGFRIEIGEIEEVLRQHPEVQETVIVMREDTPGDKRLVAYVVARPVQAAITRTLRNYLEEKLPPYMVPANFVLLDALPHTPNGKLDRRNLPVPTISRQKQDREVPFEARLLTVHYQLTQMWEDLLDVRPIGLQDDFFALGGHSLLAVQLFEKIAQIFGKKLPPATFYAGATIEHLAEVIMGEQNVASRTPLVAVQAVGSKRPFFFLHGDWAGGGFYCLNLSRDLGTDQPFYVLEPYKFEGLHIPPTIEAMAAAHIMALRIQQPEGPYLLGGFCNGGLMAYEIARQLRAAGEKVEMLALIDPADPAPHHALHTLIKGIGKLTRLGEDKQLELFLRYIYMSIPGYREKVRNAQKSKNDAQAEHDHNRTSVGPLQARLARFMPTAKALRYPWAGIYRWVVSSYMPGKYDDKITFLWSSEAYNENQGWHKLVAGQSSKNETHIFPGTHSSCKTTNLPIIAERLGQCLANLETGK